jgi:hypothetical protein
MAKIILREVEMGYSQESLGGKWMANSGTFRKGIKRPGQGKHGSPRASLAAREAIARFVDGNTERLQGWLDEIAERDGPRAAFQCVVDLLEFHCPKLARQERTGLGDGPEHIIVSWADGTTLK